MYLAIGKEKWIDSDDLIGIFDLDITSQSHLTRRFLREAEKSGSIVNTAEDLPKSFAVCAEGEKRIVYLCQMTTATLAKRIQ